MKRRLFRSLQAKYMLIIFMALFLMQISYLLIAIVLSIGIDLYGKGSTGAADMPSAGEIEAKWHADAARLTGGSAQEVRRMFEKWKAEYPGAGMFWVDGEGRLAEQMDVAEELPSVWTAAYTAQFIKSRYGGDPFTVIAFAGGRAAGGFVVIEMPREQFDPPLIKIYNRYGFWLIVGLIAIVLLFILISYLFFRGIRRRLVQLQEAMTIRDVDGLPVQIDVTKDDEIGQLQHSFNRMVVELKESKRREQEEEQLRRELIANLSHDLRTPLTKIRAQAYTLGIHPLTEEGRKAIEAMEQSIVNMDHLIDNLMAYTLLMANKYRQEAKQVDIIRFVKEHLATWYPLFEKEGFEVEVELGAVGHPVWTIDPLWMGRVLDNIYQNVLRYAKQGRYIHVSTEAAKEYDAIVIEDRGTGARPDDQKEPRPGASPSRPDRTGDDGGMSPAGSRSDSKGAGIGLSIVDRMLKGMGLDWDIRMTPGGTTIKVKRMNGRTSE